MEMVVCGTEFKKDKKKLVHQMDRLLQSLTDDT